jgi:hypothetical protein
MSSQVVSRSVYVDKLRRAFLLRAHPDKFRSHGASIRLSQTNLLKALSQRMRAQDFQDYSSNSPKTAATLPKSANVIGYVIEKRDGSLLQQTLNINDSVEGILESLSRSLKKSGAVPPTSPTVNVPDSFQKAKEDFKFSVNGTGTAGIDRRFDVNTARGRDFLAFLQSVDSEEIERRRASRIGAIAIASVVRQLYSFQAVDGIRLAWSSENFAFLLSSLVKLHEEHSERFHVESFYPLRLVFTPDEFRYPLDIHGGFIYLHPASTKLQWLEALQKVTPDSLLEFEQNRRITQERTALLQNTLGVKVVKGHSCTSRDYHIYLKQLSETLMESMPLSNDSDDSKSLQMERLRLVVESPLACRRARLTNEGHIQVNSWMPESELKKAISRLSQSAQERLDQEQECQQRCKEITNMIQYKLGLQRVFRTGVISRVEFLNALSRLMEQPSDLSRWLSGNSLGIGTSGRFCHLGDDGSMIVPHDWR